MKTDFYLLQAIILQVAKIILDSVYLTKSDTQQR